ncbi:DUF6088 family protein [Polynucleobacter sp. JS-JIR-II-c23]|uniref:DUF6088 family protein n=1 Tax=Polynucleobacter sp. JS-JIR-II-c23 TaxID=1758393 RepID=UPI002B2295C9|nr:DUF6088 family protein [Polynucleobacter sp. JS-JIR-II-c23]MEA9604627.1 DUF6088 family protein [Polynucleobacter sp. JS-JIR-II-c23]
MQKEPVKPSLSASPEVRDSPLGRLRSHLKSGHVYRREDFLSDSNAVDRHLKQLVDAGDLEKLAQGLYYSPKSSAFGRVPPKDEDLVEAFLKDENFLLLSPNSYNSLGLGTTQLYNKTVVYNHKRHGIFKLGNRSFEFRVKPRFPKKVDKEFLLVDLLNNLDSLAENKSDVLAMAEKQLNKFETAKLQKMVSTYGAGRTKKQVSSWLRAPQKAST